MPGIQRGLYLIRDFIRFTSSRGLGAVELGANRVTPSPRSPSNATDILRPPISLNNETTHRVLSKKKKKKTIVGCEINLIIHRFDVPFLPFPVSTLLLHPRNAFSSKIDVDQQLNHFFFQIYEKYTAYCTLEGKDEDEEIDLKKMTL